MNQAFNQHQVDNKTEKTNNKINLWKSMVDLKVKNIEYKVYCISCFRKEIWEDELYYLASKNREVISITNEYEKKLENDDNFLVIIHQINLSDEYISLKKISLEIRSNDKQKCFNLNDLNFTPDKDKVLFANLESNNKNAFEFFSFLGDIFNQENKKNDKIFEDNKFYKVLTNSEKLKYYLNFINLKNLQNELKPYIAEQFLSYSKNKSVHYSDIIEIFNLSFNTKVITKFLDNYETFDYMFDEEINNDEFNTKLDLYKNKKDEFFSKNIEFFKEKVKKYNASLENFITIYQIFYENPENVEQQRKSNIKLNILHLIEYKSDIIELTNLFENKINSFYQIFEKGSILKLNNKLNSIRNENDYLNFKSSYNLLIMSEDNMDYFLFDYSIIFNKLIDILNQFRFLIDIKQVYKIEMEKFQNPEFLNKINEKIHNEGINRINNDQYDNLFLINFIISDEYYNNQKFYNKNKEYKNYQKRFLILKYFNISLMDNKFFELFESNKIYSFFNENILEYLHIFYEKIKKVQYFGYFFKLLPPEEHTNYTLNLVFEWLKQHINTFSIEQCPNFANEIKIYVEICIKKKLVSKLYDIFKFLKENIGNYYINIFILLLNTLGNESNYSVNAVYEILIRFLVFSNREQDENINDKIIFILKQINPNDSITRIFLQKFNKFFITKDDFFEEKSLKIKLFQYLLNNNAYSLLNKDSNKNINYWENTTYSCEKIYDLLSNLKISFQNIRIIFKILGQKTLEKRLISVLHCLNIEYYKEKANSILSLINEVLKKWEYRLHEIESLKIFIDYFYGIERKKKYEQLSLFIKNIFNNTLENLKQYENEYISYEKEIQIAKEALNLMDSKFFIRIYRDYKEKISNKNLYEETLIHFNKIKKIFNDNKEKMEKELKRNSEIKYLINIGYENEELLNKEIDWLLDYFKITNFQNKEILKEKFKILLQNKILFSVISGLLHIFDIYKYFFNSEYKNNANINFYNELNNYKNKLKSKENVSYSEIQKIIKFIEEKFETFLRIPNNKKIIFDFFISVNQYPASIIFLKDKKSEQVDNLLEFLLEIDEDILRENDINEFIKVLKLFENIINNKEKNKLFINFIYELINGILDENKCGKCIFNYIEKYELIQNLLTNYLRKTEGSIKLIKNILDKSSFTISLNEKQNKYMINGIYFIKIYNFNGNLNKNNLDNQSPKRKQYKYLYYENLESIFQRVLLAKIPEKYIDISNNFINFFKKIKELIIIFNELYAKGYQEQIKIKIDFNKSIMSCNYNNINYSKIDELHKIFKNLESNISLILEECYYFNQTIKLFYGRQIYFICKCLIEQKEKKLENLFKVVSNNLIKKELTKPNIQFDKEENMMVNYNKMLYLIADYFEEQLKFNNKKLEDIYKYNLIRPSKPLHSNKIKSNKEKKTGIFFFISNNQEIEALSIYYWLTSNLPINACFLYCTKYTTLEELSCFLVRCIFCKYNIIFCMINLNLLNDNIRRKFISLIKNFSKKNGKKMESCLLLIFSQNDMDLHEILLRTKNINSFEKFPPKFNFDDIYKISLIKSSRCGLGKSEMIKEEKRNEVINKKTKELTNYIYFPIGGTLSRESLIRRLENLPDMSNIDKKYAIHFDIAQSNEIELLNEFFFKLLILRKCDLNENVIFFDKNVEIIIEIPNDFKDYFQEIRLLPHLKLNQKNDIKTINLTDELKIVSSIIYMYENNEILEKNYDIKKDNLKLTQEQCEKIILKYLKNLKIENPNYYQINIFIKVLANEFLKFSKCLGYSPEILKNNFFLSGNNEENALNIRKFIINSLIKVTRLFIIGPYEDLLKYQQINQKAYQDLNENEKIINKSLTIKIDSVSFDKIKPSLVVFNEDEDSCTIITTCSENEDEFKDLEKLYYSQSIDYHRIKNNLKIENMIKKIPKDKKLKNFRELKGNEILDNLLSFLNVSGLDEKKKKEILNSYVYTPDNFIKVVLILMRLRIKIPVIMMGETGCGKTTLIEMASKIINKGKIYLKKMNIHSGIVDEDIINFMEMVRYQVKNEDTKMLQQKKEEFDSLPEKDKQAYLNNNSKKNIFADYENEIKKRKIWIFFDEINTCNSMGLITEIFCKNSIYGEPLDERYIFIGACNPYRVSEKKNNNLNILYKNNKIKNLVYTVNPLPLTLLNFVFNFGNLKKTDELNYIENMIAETINKLSEKNINLKKSENKLIQIVSDCVEICQDYMKKNNDISIVSLREVNRFNVMLEFFFKYINERKNNNELKDTFEDDIINQFYQSKKDIEIFFCAVNLSLFICYYLRLPDKQSRKDLENLLNEKNYFKEGFLNVPLKEQNYLIRNFEIPKGIAKNKNLKENIFILFFCVINKIPLITCGKPGRSKTLSFQILQNSMKGQSSKSVFFRQFPKIIAFKIQGSLNTTSSEIINVFVKAREAQKNDLDKLIVVFMDEMGLAEISENNPLKVMHSELEKEIDKISFVGISNWFMDASKMNRVIYNVVQDPDKDDIIETGNEIVKSYEENGENYLEKYGSYIKRMSIAYYKFISKKKNDNDENQYFHGSRDFYSLIKSFMNEIIKNKKIIEKEGETIEIKNKKINNICQTNIERNFGGIPNSVKEFKSYFYEGYEIEDNNSLIDNNYNVKKCIEENINDDTSRYLLLITDNSLSQALVNYILEEIKKGEEYTPNGTNNDETNIDLESIQIFSNANKRKEDYKKFYSGSKFKADKKNILYSNQMLNKIKYQMETDNILILNDLETVYPNLYELFNQSYTYLEGKKFVHLGESKSLALVNDKFKVIVLVNKNLVKYQEPPFLNRFEKHIISFSYLLGKDLLSLANNIYNNLNEILALEIENKDFDIKKAFKKHLAFIKEEEIKGLIYISIKKYNCNLKDNNDIENNKITEFVLKNISPCFTEELLILAAKFGYKKIFNYEYNVIYNSYKEKYCFNFLDYLSKLKEEISIVYTFSSIVDDIIDEQNSQIKNQFFGIDFSKEKAEEININTIYRMEQIEKEIINFFYNDERYQNNIPKNLLILKFRKEDLNKFNDIFYLIKEYKENPIKNLNYRKSKIIVFIIYLSYSLEDSNYLSFLLNCPQIMISNFNNKYMNFHEIVDASNEDLINKKLIDVDSLINDNIDSVLRYFSFDLKNCVNSTRQFNQLNNSFKEIFINQIKKNKYLKDILIKCIAILIKHEEDLIIKIFNKEIFNNENFSENLKKHNFMLLLYKYLNDYFINYLRKIIFILEKEQIISSMVMYKKNCENKIITNYINDYIIQIDNEENNKFIWNDKDLNSAITIPVLFGQKLPFCHNIFKSLFFYIQKNISINYIEKENLFFKRIKNEKNIKTKYLKDIHKLNDNLGLELLKYKIILDILYSNNINLIYNLFDDLFYTFILKNDKLLTKFEDMNLMLQILIQIRLQTRLNEDLNLPFLKSDKIKLKTFCLDLIKKESQKDIKDNNESINNIQEGDTEPEIESQNKLNNNKNENNQYLNFFIEIINFLQSYSKEIYIILEMYYFLLDYIPTLYNDMLSIISKKHIEMENGDLPSYRIINNLCFSYILESLIIILEKNLKKILFTKTKNNLKKECCQSIENIIENALKLEKRFMIFNKEIFNLEIIIKIIHQIQLKNNLQFNYLIDETLKLLLEGNTDNLKEQIISINNHLIKIFGDNSEEYNRLMSKIILNKYKSENKIKFKVIILKIILDNEIKFNEKIIMNLYPIVQSIFDFFNLEKSIEKIQKDKIFNNIKKDELIEIINDKNNTKINTIILYQFEIGFEFYFHKIINENKNNSNIYENLCQNISQKLLEEAINNFYNIDDKNEVKNIYILNFIAFIKKYLYYYIYTLLNDIGFQKLSKRDEINNIIFRENIPQAKSVRYYFLKLIIKILGDWEKLEKFKFEKYFPKNIISHKKDFPLFFCNKIKNENLNYLENLFRNKLNQENKEKFLNLFLQNENFDSLYILISNLFLLSYYNSQDENNNIINEQNNYYNDLLISVNKYLNSLDIEKDILFFINTFFQSNTFDNLISNKLGFDKIQNNNLKLEKIKILLYALRFVFLILIKQKKNMDNKNLFYNNLLSKEVYTTIEKNYIPGNFMEANEYDNQKGIKIIDKDIFFQNNRTDIEIDDITYRLLNFILYSFLFYSNIQGFIKDKNLKKLEINSMSTFEIIEADWDILKNLLDFPIEIFFNIIFDSICNKLLIAENFKTKNDLNIFKEEIKGIIISKKDDKKLIEEFKENNSKYINIIPIFDRAIIEEKYPSEIYSDNQYPYLRYFYTSEFPNKKHFISEFNQISLKKEKYPILDIIVNAHDIQEKILLMSNLPFINKICNNMIKLCSFKYTRDEAKQKKIKYEIIDDKEINNNSLSNFKEIYEKLVSYLKKEKIFNFEVKLDKLPDELVLSDLCVDSSEKNYGYILFLIYKSMIKWQNSFIDNLRDSKNENIERYKELFESAIMIQDYEEDQLLQLPKFEDEFKLKKKEIINNENIDLMDLILTNSYRKENIIFYNYDEIEEQLASSILPKIRRFKSDIKTVIYQYETFLGNRKGIITEFINKYKQRKLSEEELVLVINYIENNKNIFDIKNFLFSLQLLIDIILDYNFEIDKTLFSLLNNFKESNFEEFPNIKIINDFFTDIYKNNKEENKNDDKLFTINCLIDLMDIIQLYCWKNIRKNLDKKYINNIDENIEKKIDNHFEKENLDKNNYKITKIDLCTAIRIYISRFLLGKNDIDPKNNLNIYLKNIELWQSNYEIDIIEDEINIIFKDIKVEISQAAALYDYLGGDMNKLDEVIKKYNINNEYIDDTNNIIINDNINDIKDCNNINEENQNKKESKNETNIFLINSHNDIEEEEEEEEEKD